MHTLKQLEKQQVGLRLHRYLVDEIDELTETFSLNRSEIIAEAIRSYLSAQRESLFYANFDEGCQELNAALNTSQVEGFKSLDDLIDELENN
jgi:predicted transcriptional regulator